MICANCKRQMPRDEHGRAMPFKARPKGSTRYFLVCSTKCAQEVRDPDAART